jgi:hypothetical protein
MSIGKSLRNVASRLSGKSSKSSKSEDAVVDYSGLRDLWPDGTWDLAWGKSSMKEMDLCMRGVLLDVWAVESRQSLEKKVGRALNPGMYQPDPIPMGWKPKLKSLKYVFAGMNMDPKLEPYVLGKLRNMGRVRG